MTSFTHDITYHSGLISILSSDPNIPAHYFEHAIPAVCTSEHGRHLAPGIYTNLHISDYSSEDCRLISLANERFEIDNSLHFMSKEADFQFNVLNNLEEITTMVHKHFKVNHSLIAAAKCDTNKLRLPVSSGFAPEEVNGIVSPIVNLKRDLPKQQKKVLNLLCKGMSSKEIAVELSLSPRTVDSYILLIRRKFRAANRVELVKKYIAKP